MHLLDLVQNSIEAKATKILLEIIEDRKADWLTLRVSDNGRGMTPIECQRALDPFVTSRGTRNIGLGLPLIQMSSQRCGGRLTINSTPGEGTIVEAVYRYSHLDRPPMGNMVGTLRVILIGNPLLHFHYIHKVDNKQFSLSTLEIVNILGEIPLTSPEVLEWLEAYLTSQIDILYGGAENENP